MITNLLRRILIAVVAVSPMQAIAAGLPPWKFGMSKAEVASFTDFGPYGTFKNGDLETYKGRFHGRMENVQFFFDATGLIRIGVYLYEGKDIKQAMSAWRRAYELFKGDYGPVAMPAIKASTTGDPVTAESLAIAAGANTEASGETDMAPVKQPVEISVSSRFFRRDVEGSKFYYVVIFLDPAPNSR